MSNFNLGDRVSWQARNKYRSNHRQVSFYIYQGDIDSVSPLTATYKYAGRNEQGQDVTRIGRCEFRQLRNGKYIPKTEDRDDPKGRLYLTKIEETA